MVVYTRRRQTNCEDKENGIDNYEIRKKQQIYIDKAAEIAKYSTMQQKHGAVIVHKNKIVGCGFNYMNNHLNDNHSIHAEVAAICQVFKNKEILEECDIYVVRIASAKFDNCLKMSKPCEKCTSFINKYNIRRTYYSTNYEFDIKY